MPDDAALLEEIRERFQVCTDAWDDIRKEAQKDMRYIAGDPWDPKERKQRENAMRPCLSPDELGQYVNDLINNVRQNPISIKINPAGEGATDEKATFKENMIRGIEYKSKAQSAYTTGFENAAQRSYGFWRVSTQYVDDDDFNQEIVIKRIPNPDSVYIDPDTKEADASDMMYAFIVDPVPRKEYKRKYPRAEIHDFTAEHLNVAPQWIRENQILVAEYWKVKVKSRTLMLVDSPQGPTPVYQDELPKDAKPKVLKSRKVETRSVCQYITNGVEILEENEWAGKWIPIVAVFGKELYIDDGSGSKRVLMSLIRLARDPYMLYCYLWTKQAEEAAMTPLAPYQAYEGQIEGHEEEYQNASKVPVAVLLAKARTEATGDQVLPLPTRQQFVPNFAAYQIATEAARRAIQAAMGTSALPTAAQRQNEKSGVALQRISAQQDLGSFHFIDNYKKSIEHTGRIILDLSPHIYDTPREVMLSKADETHEVGQLTLNPETGQIAEHEGEYGLTVNTGPSYDSQREEAEDFANSLAQTELFPRVADLIVKLKRLGPIGDQIAERLTPPEFAQQGSPQESIGKLQQANQQLQAMHAYAQTLETEMKKLQAEKQGKVVDNEYKMQIEKLKIDAQMAMAEVTTKAQELNERIKFVEDVWKELHGSAHDLALQQQDHANTLEQAQQGHEQALEQGEQAGQQQQDLAAQSAASQEQAGAQ